MASMVTVHCEYCEKEFEARTADRKRGWGRFCTKRCKASEQEKRTGQYAELIHREKPKRRKHQKQRVSLLGLLDRKIASGEVLCIDDNYYSESDVDESDGSWDAHKF